jgi:hypothetical protein
MRRFLALPLVVMGMTAVVGAKNVVIGQIQYLGTNVQGVSAFKITLNTTGITESAITFDSVRLAEQGSEQGTGSITTPLEVLFLGGNGLRMPACPCRTIRAELLLKGGEPTFTFRLADGEWFTARRVNWTFLQPVRGQQFLVPGQSAPIVLSSIPEPWGRRPTEPFRRTLRGPKSSYSLP